jgi:hypothetical protein
MTRTCRWQMIALLMVLALPVTAATPEPDPRIRLATRDLFADPLWDDGRAEYTTYRGTIERYGAKRPLKARLIVVKEDMDVTQRVKSDVGPVPGRTWTVLKQNYSHDFTTGTYDYHQMSSAFLDRTSGVLHKLTVSSQEACGLTFAELVRNDRGFSRVLHSYWDGEASQTRAIGMSDPIASFIVIADALPLWLRRLDLTRPQSFYLDVVPRQLANRAQPLELRLTQIEVAGGPDRYGLLVRVRETSPRVDAPIDRYWFDPAWPHPLVRFEGGTDATVLERVKTMRIAYWKETAPGDERLLEP